MQNTTVETLIGAVVIVIAALFFFYAYNTADVRPVRGYEVSARLSSVSGVSVGTDVRIAGIKVGSVVRQELDPHTYDAVLTMVIERHVELPQDSSLTIGMDGLLGDRFVSIRPGGDFDNLLAHGDEITITQGSLDLMSLISSLVFGSGDSVLDRGARE
jgi:phospholipid/cholesterol/gamma-HCH transport system substrate-binding protein